MSIRAKRLGAAMLVFALPLAAESTWAIESATPPAQENHRPEQDLLGGVLTNRTVTVLGWDFYQYFAAVWQAKYGKERFSLSVVERPTARWGSEIWIEYRQQRVFHAFLAPARSATKEVSRQAADIVYKNVVQSNIRSSLFNDVDMAPEEM